MSRLVPILLLFVNCITCMGQVVFDEASLNSGMKHNAIASDFMGAAVAVFDYNNDGWQDIYLTGGLEPDKLFKNLGKGIFKDATSEAGGFAASISYKTTSVVTADLDNDGYREVIVGTARNMPMFVYKNNKNGTFTHITPSTGITTTKNTMGVVAGDYNLDGLVDLYVLNYVQTPRTILDSNGDIAGYAHTCYPNEFYKNNGSMTFSEIAASLSVDNTGCSLAAIFTDIDGDYKPDLYVANDFGNFNTQFVKHKNVFLKNLHPSPTFQDLSIVSHLNDSIFGMGIAQADYDKDGLQDIYVTNLGRNVLHRQTSPGVFQDVTTAAGVEDGKDPNNLNVVGWGTAFLDYDNDSYEDLYVSNGYVPASKAYETGLKEDNKLYHNLKNGTFEDVSLAAKVNEHEMHRGMAVGDFDNDGDEDMIVTKLVSTGVPLQTNVLLYMNQQSLGRHWLQVSLKGSASPTHLDAYGSTVKVFYNNTKSIKTLQGGSSHASQNSSVMHFGLNTTAVVDSVQVFWPGGTKSTVKLPPVDSHILIEENQAGFKIRGCMTNSGGVTNYNPLATQNYGCYIPVPGCTNVEASNYNSAANLNNNTCDFTLVTDVMDERAAGGAAVYPNPMKQELYIRAPAGQDQTFELFDGQGKSVYRAEFSENQITLKPDIREGLYYYRLTSNGKTIKTGKIIKQ